MRWPAPVVAGIARAAGWTGDDLTMAVAVALAGSDGDDSFVLPGVAGLVDDRIGWWLIPAGDLDYPARVELARPAVNAETARQLWADAGGSWAWNPAYAAGTWTARLDEARAAGQRPAGGIVPTTGQTAARVPAAALAVARRVAERTAELLAVARGLGR